MKNDNEIARCVRKAMDGYFRDLDGERPCAIYNMVISSVEKPLLELVLHRVAGVVMLASEDLATPTSDFTHVRTSRFFGCREHTGSGALIRTLERR